MSFTLYWRAFSQVSSSVAGCAQKQSFWHSKAKAFVGTANHKSMICESKNHIFGNHRFACFEVSKANGRKPALDNKNLRFLSPLALPLDILT
jgi:hypothetical protein